VQVGARLEDTGKSLTEVERTNSVAARREKYGTGGGGIVGSNDHRKQTRSMMTGKQPMAGKLHNMNV
jgi:hypothetical protein